MRAEIGLIIGWHAIRGRSRERFHLDRLTHGTPELEGRVLGGLNGANHIGRLGEILGIQVVGRSLHNRLIGEEIARKHVVDEIEGTCGRTQIDERNRALTCVG